MSFLADCQKWSNPDGTMSNAFPPVRTDNPYTFTSTKFFIGEHLLGLSMSEDRWEFVPYLDTRTLKEGLYDQEVSWSERTLSHDEINGLAAFSAMIAYWMYLYGRFRFWTYINRPLKEIIAPAFVPVTIQKEMSLWQRVRLKAWSLIKKPIMCAWLPLREIGKQNIWKMGYLVPAMKCRAGKTPWLIEELWYCWDIAQAANKPWGDTSTKCLFLLQSRYKNEMTPRMQRAMDEFLQAMQEMYGDYSAIYSIYFGKDHPFTIHTKGIKFV